MPELPHPGPLPKERERNFSASFIVILFLLAFILFVGCSSRSIIKDNSTLVIQPGLGISNICALNMNLAQIRAATHDVRIVKLDPMTMQPEPWSWKRLLPRRSAATEIKVPSLGASIGTESDHYPYGISFAVAADAENKTPFRGNIGQKLSCKELPISREKIEAAFGKITQTIQSRNATFPGSDRTEPFDWQHGQGWDELNYPAQGISFSLHSNILKSFYVFSSRKGDK
jgi:hypothetical protein